MCSAFGTVDILDDLVDGWNANVHKAERAAAIEMFQVGRLSCVPLPLRYSRWASSAAYRAQISSTALSVCVCVHVFVCVCVYIGMCSLHLQPASLISTMTCAVL